MSINIKYSDKTYHYRQSINDCWEVYSLNYDEDFHNPFEDWVALVDTETVAIGLVATLSDKRMVTSYYYYKPNSLYAIDRVLRDENGNPIGYEGIKAQYGEDVIIVSFDELNEKINTLAVEKPKEIDEKTFFSNFGRLPTFKIVNNGNTHSFMSSEFYVCNTTMIYCKIGDRYWYMRNKYSLTHDEIVNLCKAEMAMNNQV